MTLFEKIVNSIIKEDVQIGKINDAINRTYEVKINYQSENDNASGERIIQPVAYGLTKAGNPVIRAYQPFGDTQTKVPSWKFFLVSGIQKWKPLFKRVFDYPPAGFNPNGDKTMSVVYNIANFRSNTYPKVEDEKNKISGPIKKSDIENLTHIGVQDNSEIKKLQKLKKQLEHPKYIAGFGGENDNVNNKNQEIKASTGPVYKNEEDDNVIKVKDNSELKKLEKLRKQLDNPTYISDIIKNNAFGDKTNNKEIKNNSGPIYKDTYQTQSEKDIESRKKQFDKNQKISDDILKQWEKEQEKRRKYGTYKK